MSTPSGRPVRPASVFDYAPKRVRDQWHRGETNGAADAESTGDPPTGDHDDRAHADPGGDADERISSLVPKGPHEDPDDDADDPGDADDRRAQDWEHDDPERAPDEPRHGRTEDWLDELEYRAELRERRAKAAEIDREYEDQLERLAASLRTLRDEDEGETDDEPERPLVGEPRRRRSHSPDGAERDLYIDGVRLPRFLQASYVPPRGREGRFSWRGFVVACAIACGVGVPLSYYVYAVGNPFASRPDESMTKSDVQYTIASTSSRLPKIEERVADAPLATTPPPAPIAAATAAPAAPRPAPALQPPAAQAEPSQSPPPPRRVPLTHVVRWPDQAPDNSAASPPRAASVGAASPSPRPAPPPAFAPNAPATSLAYAPALAPAPAAPALAPAPPARALAPAPARPAPADDTDEVQLLLKQGQDFIAAGDLATARVVLRRAAQVGASAAAFMLAQTYDPMVLAKMRARGVDPDPAEARRWYEMAQKLGSREAAQQLDRLARDE
jgi:hypothetical protein